MQGLITAMDSDALSLILWPSRPTPPSPHFNYITCLAHHSSSSSLFSAARDARVIQWQQQQQQPSSPGQWLPAAAATPHTDWINDIQCVGAADILSCSSDCNVTLTNVVTGTVSRQFRYHEDHVTCLSPIDSRGKFLSAGLDGFCCQWDAELCGGGGERDVTAWSSPEVLLCNKKRTSVYCTDLACDGR